MVLLKTVLKNLVPKDIEIKKITDENISEDIKVAYISKSVTLQQIDRIFQKAKIIGISTQDKNLENYIKQNFNLLLTINTDKENIIVFSKFHKTTNFIKPIISICIPSYNRKEVVLKAVSLWNTQKNISPDIYEIIIVENGSDLLSEEDFKEYKNIKLLKIPEGNIGLARKISVEKASGEFLLLVNDDTYPSEDLLIKHLTYQLLFSKEKIAILGKFLLHPDFIKDKKSQVIVENCLDFSQNCLKDGTIINDIAFFVTNNLSIRKKYVLKAGNFSEELKRGGEDSELGYKFFQKGGIVLFKEDLIAYHYHNYIKNLDKIMFNRGITSAHMISKNEKFYKDFYEKNIQHINLMFKTINTINLKRFEEAFSKKFLHYLYYRYKHQYYRGLLKGFFKYINPVKFRRFFSIYKNPPIISIFVSIDKNNYKNLKVFVKSLLKQTYSNWELIVITKNNIEKIDKLLNKLVPQNKYILINNGSNMSKSDIKGKYVALLKPDNVLMPYYIESITKFYSISDTPIIYGDYIDGQNVKVNPIFENIEDYLKFYSEGNILIPETFVFKRKILLKNNVELSNISQMIPSLFIKYLPEKIDLPLIILSKPIIQDWYEIYSNINHLIFLETEKIKYLLKLLQAILNSNSGIFREKALKAIINDIKNISSDKELIHFLKQIESKLSNV
ncbi:glycosyltransferase [Persephonella sp.]|uniref:glycosyltransferase family 2 protein n=1 Tax=Persephonella sp. TaxID=2060922 RepID=UPI002628F15C|nr:glycosyltransferase [Persephonella sp.]